MLFTDINIIQTHPLNHWSFQGAGCCCFRACPTSRQGLKTDPPREDVDFQHWKIDEFGVCRFIFLFIFDGRNIAKTWLGISFKKKQRLTSVLTYLLCWILQSLSSWDLMSIISWEKRHDMFGILFKKQTNFERRTSWESKGTTPPPPVPTFSRNKGLWKTTIIHQVRYLGWDALRWACRRTEVWGHQIFIGSWCKLWDVSGHPPFPLFSPPTCRFGYFGCCVVWRWWFMMVYICA